MSERINSDRRRFLTTTVFAAAAAGLSRSGATHANAADPIRPKTSPSLGPLKQIDTGLLTVGYADVGPSNGPPVILLHGWPYDIHTYEDVAPLLGSAGYRVLVPYLRGYGTTRFRSKETPRNGQQSVLAVDVIALMDALRIDKAIVAGCDWGARTANIVAALWPERCKAHVSVSGYLIGNREANKRPLPPKAELEWWYQFYFATDRGRAGYEAHRRDFAKLIWRLASPRWNFDDATFDRSAESFENPDHVDIVIHNYRWRLGLAEGEAKYDVLEERLAKGPVITVPTITLEGDANGAPHPHPSSYAKKFARHVYTPRHHGRHRAQLASRSAARLRQGGRRGRQVLREEPTMGLDKVLYTAKTHTTGGRDGASHSDDGRLAVKLSTPGTPGSGTNPEQLFAAGWSACFLSSMRLVAGRQKLRLPPDATIDAEVDLGTMDGAQALVDGAHQVCTYSRATRGNVDLTITLV